MLELIVFKQWETQDFFTFYFKVLFISFHVKAEANIFFLLAVVNILWPFLFFNVMWSFRNHWNIINLYHDKCLVFIKHKYKQLYIYQIVIIFELIFSHALEKSPNVFQSFSGIQHWIIFHLHKPVKPPKCDPHFILSLTWTAGKKSHLRKTSEKKPPTKESISKLQQSNIWKMENEFYEFALEQFQFVRAHSVREKDGELYLLAQNFFYEKIYPKVN